MQSLLMKGVLVSTTGMALWLLAVALPCCADPLPDDVAAFQDIQTAGCNLYDAMFIAQSPELREKARADYTAELPTLAKRCCALSEKYPNSTGELAALYWAAFLPTKDAAKDKVYQLCCTRIATADLDQLALAIQYAAEHPGANQGRNEQDIAHAILERVKQNLVHPKAARLLTQVCCLSYAETHADPPPIFAESAELIVSKHADSPDINNLCELLGTEFGGNPSWARQYERHLREILEVNQYRQVRCAGLIALASIVQSAGDSRKDDAIELYKRFLSEFDGEHQYPYQNIEQRLREAATIQLDELVHPLVGDAAQELVGLDLDGKPMKLSDYRGKVVLLSFWSTSCAPCMRMIPHERALAARLKDEPFAIIGVSLDEDHAEIEKAVASHQITWRSFRNKRADKSVISSEWRVIDWPTLYLIDREGIVRNRWTDETSPEELNREADRLVVGSSKTAK
jgi:thiol-disulfide isomerase/thioredoxin